MHAASVGEVQAAGILINELLSGGENCNIVLTVMTEYGRQVARDLLPVGVSCYPAPLDLPQAVRRFLDRVHPAVYVGFETELWPVLLTEIRLSGIPAVLLNGRMSERSFRNYRVVRGFMGRLLETFTAISVIREEDKERFAFFGVPEDRIQVSGNIKYDFALADPEVERKKYRALLGLQEEKLFICGSTRSGEERVLADVFRQLQEKSGEEVVWLIAPRHLERLEEVQRILSGCGFSYDLFTDLKNRRKNRENSVVLVDMMGELARIYSAGDYIFSGGSFADKGGHNVMEAARWGKPVYYGPNMNDFMDAAQLLESFGAGFMVKDGNELVRVILHHIRHPAEYELAGNRALEIAEVQHGAAGRQADMVKKLLPGRQQ